MSEDRIYIECECSSPYHLVSFFRDESDIGVNVQMSPYLPLWRRLIVAFRYVCGDHPKCHWADTLIPAAQRERVAAFLTSA